MAGSAPIVHVRTLARSARIAFVLATMFLAACGERSPEAPSPVAELAEPATAVPLPSPPLNAQTSRAADAAIAREAALARQSAACLGQEAKSPSPAPAIHRWVDAAGVTHYSDQAPAKGAREHRLIALEAPPAVAVSASGWDVNLPPGLQQRAVVDALAVRRVFGDALGIAAPASLALRIVFVRDGAAYAKLVGDDVLANSAGAYAPSRKTIFVRMQPDDETGFSVMRHEITHALIHELVGNLPVVLNEGLAEYFRRYRVAGMGGQIDLAADRAALARAAPAGDGEEALVDLLALEGSAFYATSDREPRYLRAYALIATLLQSQAGTAALHALLERQRADPCKPVAAETVLDARYPGGLVALARDWARFLADPPQSVRAY